MSKKFLCLIKYSLKKKTSTKWFKAVNILLCVLIVAIANIDRIISYFGGDFENTTNIKIIDNIGVYDNFEKYFKAGSEVFEDYDDYTIEKINGSYDEVIKDIKENDIVINIEDSDTNYLKADVASYNSLSMISTQLISNTLNSIKNDYVIVKSNLSLEEINSLTNNVEIQQTVTNPDANTYKDGEYKELLSSGLITIFIVPFFIFITTLTQMLGAEVNDEKSCRGMEIIITSVPAKVHFFSKIIASLSFVFMQTFLFIGYGILGFIIRNLLGSYTNMSVNNVVSSYISEMWTSIKSSGLFDVILKALPIIIIMILVSFLAYAILAAVLASMTTNIEDYQQLQTPMMMIIMAGYFLAILASGIDGSVFINVMGFVPFISVLLAPVLYLIGQISFVGLCISTCIMIFSTVLLYYFGIRIYKVGILNYSSNNLWKKIFKSLRKG